MAEQHGKGKDVTHTVLNINSLFVCPLILFRVILCRFVIVSLCHCSILSLQQWQSFHHCVTPSLPHCVLLSLTVFHPDC